MSHYTLAKHSPRLESLGADLVKRLGGEWRDGKGMCLCPAHADSSPSLSVRVGDTALLFKCFAGCDSRDVLRAIRRLDSNALASVPAETDLRARPSATNWLRQRALELWDTSSRLQGSSAQEYLRRRSLTTPSPALRFNPRTPLGGGKLVTFRPALIAALHEAGSFVAVQRTFLDLHEPRRARDLANPRRMLGRPFGGAVVLAPASGVLGLAEGVETAFSAMVLLGLPVWATLGNERFARIALPDTVTRLVLLPDNDRGGRIGAAKASAAYAMPGRTIETVWPPAGFNDWNDLLRKYGKDALSHFLQAA